MKTIIAVVLLAISTHASAMLECYNTTTAPEMTYAWTVGQPFLPPEFPYQTTSCYATGAELTYIVSRLSGLHYAGHGPYTVWSDADADFIIDNLR